MKSKNPVILLLLPLFFLPLSLSAAELTAKITIPYLYSIVRGDVPVYGIASGTGFVKYRLEYGAGEKPDTWILITESNQEQTEDKSRAQVDFSLNKTIPGNLGMWDTGLTEYEYGEHKVNLPVGIYTLRLTVTDKQSRVAEDHISVEVGRVILNTIGGKVESPDQRASLTVPEHALYSAVEVVSLKPLTRTVPAPGSLARVSPIYEMNPPGLKFTRAATLQINYDTGTVTDPNNMAIFFYNTADRKWEPLDSFRKGSYLEADVKATPAKFSLFAIFRVRGIQPSIRPEEHLGQWRSDYGEVGALLERIPGQGLKLSNPYKNGNFGCIVSNQPYDARQNPLISFDYRIPRDVSIDFYVKVNGKWFDIVFTSPEKIYWDINMEKGGTVPGVQADNKWHHAEFNLLDMLKGRVNQFQVQRIELADWESTGFMRLEFGHNNQGAAFFIDKFTIK